MKYRCPIPAELVPAASGLEEFANGAARATIRLKDGRLFREALVSNGSAVVAIRGHRTPPFAGDEIEAVYQTREDRRPQNRGGWEFWDEWISPGPDAPDGPREPQADQATGHRA